MHARRRSKKITKDLLRLGDFLPDTLKKKKIYLSIRDTEIAAVWESTVGRQISDQTDPVRFRSSRLYINVTTPAWMQQLQYMKHEILAKLNECLPSRNVTALHFSIGPVSKKTGDPGKSQFLQFDTQLLRPREKRLIKENISQIADQELREIIERVMIKEILTRRLRS
ncbi:MAG: DUF721 domain-containing protein [Syntrophales bacterium]|jgi:hypothetical protein|nr:DUF721 domain-containing protein [Syntrophales bacterium]MDY0044265.1 DUF721 domain-containing protein [Syntrophales bacterium]